MSKYLAILFIVLMFYGCGNENEFPKVYTEAYNAQATRNIDGHDGSVNIKMSAFKLVPPSDSLLMSIINSDIEKFLFAKLYVNGEFENIEQMADTLFEEYKSLVNDFPEIPYSYEIERDVEVATDTLGIFSFSMFEFTFTGGAHPNSYKSFSNYSTTIGEELRLHDLFADKYEYELNVIAEKIFREERHLEPKENLDDAGYWFKDGQFKLNNNFLITKNGLSFYFNPYEVAAYAEGPIEIAIPYTKIMDIINLEGPLRPFIN